MTDPAALPPLDRTVAGPPPEQLLNPLPSPAHPPQPGAQQRAFGRFVIVKELGRGGMGVVLQAWDARLSRHVAIKVVDPALAGGNALARFQREAQAMGRLNHPGIVPVLEVGEEQGRPYLVMELVQGESLEALLRREKLPLRRGVELVRDVAQALAEAHRVGVLHRDIKPGNVLVDETGRPRLTDFGLARVGVASLTKTGDLLGTPTYMPPEQTGETATTHGPPSDVYSLGVLLYRTLTGRTPIEAANVTEYMTRLVTVVPKPMRAHEPAIDPALDAIASRCLQKAPDERYPHAGALADALTAWLAGSASRRSSPLPFVATFLGGALLAGGAVALAVRPGREATVVVVVATEPVTPATEPAAATPTGPLAIPPLWAKITGERTKLVRVIGDPGQRHAEGVKAIAVSPDGAWVVSADGHPDDQGPAFVHLWALGPGGLREERAWRAGSGWITSLAFSRDGEHVIAGARDGTLQRWDRQGTKVGLAMTGEPVRALQVIDDTLTFVARDDEVAVVNLATRASVARQDVRDLTAAALLPGTPWRALVLVAAGDAILLSLADGERKAIGSGCKPALAVRVSEDGAWALSAGEGGQVREWDLTKETLAYSQNEGVSADFLRGEGRAWVAAAADGKVYRRTAPSTGFAWNLYDLRVGEKPLCLTSPGGGRVLVGSEMRRLALIELDGRELRSDETPGGIWPGALAVHQGHVVAGYDGTPDRACVRVLSLDDGRTLATARTGGVRPAATLVHGDTLVVVDRVSNQRECVAAFDLRASGLRPTWTIKLPGDINHVPTAALQPGRVVKLLVGDGEGGVYDGALPTRGEGLVVVATQRRHFTSEPRTSSDVAAVLALDEETVVFGVVDRAESAPWAAWSGRLVLSKGGTRQAHELPGGVSSLVRLSDTRVLVGCMDGRVLEWDPTAAGPPRPLEGWVHDQQAVWDLAAPPSGRHAVSCGRDGRVIVWDVARGKPLDAIDLTPTGDVGRAVAFVDETTFVVGTGRGVVLRFELTAP